jgi:hypothetical protein
VPSPPTFGTVMCATTVRIVSATIATSGAGTAVVSFGRNTMMARATATIG